MIDLHIKINLGKVKVLFRAVCSGKELWIFSEKKKFTKSLCIMLSVVASKRQYLSLCHTNVFTKVIVAHWSHIYCVRRHFDISNPLGQLYVLAVLHL